MQLCPGCYNQCRKGAKFCNKCGYKFGTPAEDIPPPTAPINEEDIPCVEMPANRYAMEKYASEGSFALDRGEIDRKKVSAKNLVKLFATVAGGLTLIWLPFMDIVFLLPLQCAMVITIARMFGQRFSFEMAKDLIMTCLAGTAGFLGAYVCSNFIPYIGKLMSAPIIFACTYGVGDVAVEYFSQEGKLTRAQMRDIYSRSFENSKGYYSGDLGEVKDSLNKIKDYLTPEEYEKLKKRMG